MYLIKNNVFSEIDEVISDFSEFNKMQITPCQLKILEHLMILNMMYK